MSNPKAQEAVAPSVGAIGSGTGLVAIAQILGTDTLPSKIILYLAPFATFIMGSVLLYFMRGASRYFQQRDYRKVRRAIIAVLEDPSVDETVRLAAKAALIELDKKWLASQIAGVTFSDTAMLSPEAAFGAGS
jgi:hypothetical protein